MGRVSATFLGRRWRKLMVNANDLGKGGDGVGVNSEKERLTAYDY